MDIVSRPRALLVVHMVVMMRILAIHRRLLLDSVEMQHQSIKVLGIMLPL
jgi:hypothetical protein